jgi:hypothetical protein
MFSGLSWIPVPDIYAYMISDPGFNNSNKRGGGGGGKISFLPFLCSHIYHKIENYFIFEQVKKKIRSN